ncbi:hypothetical protein GCM10009001_28750 [Virgibacillus siamensis]|uniref:Uncharacterized protein n=1 Tax=Virgibacillus siamensis TaxID=480071 RepID=A0ABN1GE41_9BACI
MVEMMLGGAPPISIGGLGCFIGGFHHFISGSSDFIGGLCYFISGLDDFIGGGGPLYT